MKVLSREEDLREFSRDSGILELRPRAAYIAYDEPEVIEAVALAKANGFEVTPRGSGTGIPSQSVGSGIVLLQERRRTLLEEPHSVVCEPAVVKSDLNALLDARSLWMPVDPSSYESCSVGGMVANNSSGSRSYKYGSTIGYVKELRAVLPEEGLVSLRPLGIDDALGAGGSTGAVARLVLENIRSISEEAPRVTKNSSGYRLEKVVHDGVFDLPRLFVGSEGTLGVVTMVKFEVRQKPAEKALLICETGLGELDRLVAALRNHSPSAIELIDKSVFEQAGRADMIKPMSKTEEPYLVFAEFDSDLENMAALERVAGDSSVASFEPAALIDSGEVAKAWQVRNETLTIAADMKKGQRSPVPGVEDLVVPPARLGELIRFLVRVFEGKGLDYISYGHAGDANLHMRPLLNPKSEADLRLLHEVMEECFEEVWRMGGSITGEHGDGMLRAPYVRRQYPRSYDVMKEVKRIYDPKGLLNPRVKIA